MKKISKKFLFLCGSRGVGSYQNTYIEATEDGIVRLLFDKADPRIVGLYTEGLQTCLAIIMVGNEGISLIHSTRVLSLQSIRDELAIVGNINFVAVAYNPDYYKNDILNPELEKWLHKIYPAINIGKEKLHLYKAKQGFVSISREKKIDFTQNPAIELRLKPLEAEKRCRINRCNSFFILGDDQIPADIQFDGQQRLPLPSLYKSLKEIEALSEHYLFSVNPYTNSLKIDYVAAYAEQKDRIIRKYQEDRDGFSLPTLETALRRATLKGKKSDVVLLLEYGASINATDPKFKRTALHIAEIHRHTEISQLLISKGANTQLRDNKRKIPSDYKLSNQLIHNASSPSSLKQG